MFQSNYDAQLQRKIAHKITGVRYRSILSQVFGKLDIFLQIECLIYTEFS